jgi:hypothetical protein
MANREDTADDEQHGVMNWILFTGPDIAGTVKPFSLHSIFVDFDDMSDCSAWTAHTSSQNNNIPVPLQGFM